MSRAPLFKDDWLPPGERHDELGILKTGKESEVHLVARHGGGRTVLLAEKRFLARERRMFQAVSTYAGVWGNSPRREGRAMKKNTRFGQEARHSRWIANEWTNLVHIYEAGVTVPPPAELLEDGYRMAFIGDGEQAAPRLSAVDLDDRTAQRVWDDLVEELSLLTAADRVHGDLSAYNVLWWQERPVLIDFSQTVDAIVHPAARDLLVRDIESLGAYFTKRRVRVDIDWVLKRIGADARRFASQVRQSPFQPRKRDQLDARVE
ncbi:MAG TPA: RIO1 family regulatory kinase/ATPase [Candidatus Limnocylindrales bacterium]|nr:RIO1 family regulatory kinase/ATPase [Candidatus Limnocylindrales bacterium]